MISQIWPEKYLSWDLENGALVDVIIFQASNPQSGLRK